jgi:hypothetical protein
MKKNVTIKTSDKWLFIAGTSIRERYFWTGKRYLALAQASLGLRLVSAQWRTASVVLM